MESQLRSNLCYHGYFTSFMKMRVSSLFIAISFLLYIHIWSYFKIGFCQIILNYFNSEFWNNNGTFLRYWFDDILFAFFWLVSHFDSISCRWHSRTLLLLMSGLVGEMHRSVWMYVGWPFMNCSLHTWWMYLSQWPIL